jgi:TonB family protein
VSPAPSSAGRDQLFRPAPSPSAVVSNDAPSLAHVADAAAHAGLPGSAGPSGEHGRSTALIEAAGRATASGGAPRLASAGAEGATVGAGATALAPSAGGPATVPPEYDAYLRRFRRRIQDSMDYPLAARRRGVAGAVEVEVLLEPSGRVAAVTVVVSSSDPLLDEAARTAVERISPEPFPASLPRRPLRVRLPLAFELK